MRVWVPQSRIVLRRSLSIVARQSLPGPHNVVRQSLPGLACRIQLLVPCVSAAVECPRRMVGPPRSRPPRSGPPRSHYSRPSRKREGGLHPRERGGADHAPCPRPSRKREGGVWIHGAGRAAVASCGMVLECRREVTKLRRGMTLVELLVVIAIIGVLIGLLLPAVHAVREAARRMQCQSNLKQLALAAHNFESAHQRFPSGGWGYQWQGFADISSPAGQPGAWPYSLLPFVEQSALYHLGSYHSDPDQRNADLHQRVGSPVPIYNCPSRRGGEPLEFKPQCQSCPRPIGVTEPLPSTVRGDYAVNAGDGAPDPQQLISWPLNFPGPDDVQEANRLARTRQWPKPPADWSGISWLARSVRMAQVTDGTSHTFLFGEKYVMRDAYHTGFDWGDNEPLYGGFNNDNHRSTHPHWPLKRDTVGEISIGSFGSAHSTGVNFAMVDGSVHHVPYEIDPQVYRWLGNRHDSQSVELPE
ncbi:MAG: prepilin-type N-terminal cleavage/methylation domain-containing protein [Pirellulaceae bacterium]|nr:MAG: prepilin-type N-terminal cleavage/methylation domain-containing protein [Pirellulaceae bacterium]